MLHVSGLGAVYLRAVNNSRNIVRLRRLISILQTWHLNDDTGRQVGRRDRQGLGYTDSASDWRAISAPTMKLNCTLHNQQPSQRFL